MTPSASNALIQWFVDYFRPPNGALLGAVIYEMFRLGDAFGRVMLNNLKVSFRSPSSSLPLLVAWEPSEYIWFRYLRQCRGVSLPGAEAYPDLASLPRRFLDLGFSAAQALTLREIRSKYIGPQQLQRLSQLEMLDEVEELELVLDHYAISWGIKFPENWSREGSDTWGLVTKNQTGSIDDGDDYGP